MRHDMTSFSNDGHGLNTLIRKNKYKSTSRTFITRVLSSDGSCRMALKEGLADHVPPSFSTRLIKLSCDSLSECELQRNAQECTFNTSKRIPLSSPFKARAIASAYSVIMSLVKACKGNSVVTVKPSLGGPMMREDVRDAIW